ncbi:hypothetical protein [Brevundimonas sp. Root1279]|uniref:hypothetical protein n=1 Tax=Brevundimonas sp. Root1279 TaxID=1736443 RepID=UPI0006F73761|nr:hypothetical protein [Brevundimonas sp. Root1279]KQW82945.1 hypothetical protein ASC65_06255 [Brevundimonas sp. Root1279]
MKSRPVVALMAALGCALSAAAPSAAQEQAVVRNLVIAADPVPFSADDLLWMEVRSGGYQLAESVNVYSSRAGVFVPVGEFSRVLDLAIGVFPSQRRAEGWVLSPDREVTIDLAAGRATIAGRAIAIGPDQAAIYGDDLYLRTDIVEQLLPVRLSADASAQVLELTPTEPLPFQQRLEREQRQVQLGAGPAGETAVRLDTPYALFTAPSFDINIGGLLARNGVDQAGRYDIRAAGDLLYSGMEAYVGSDDDGRVNDVRVMLSRKDADGRALGPLGGTRAGIGDVFTPSLAIGAASFAGRGVFYTSAPLESLDIGTPLDLRGELPVGEEVELYVNEVLRGSQVTAVQGRYQFLDVPLAYGLNTIRLVFYGAHGETREVVRRINFGSGQIEAGKVVLRLGAVQQGRTVFDVGDVPFGQDDAGRLVAALDYGLTPGLTVSAGAAFYTPLGQDARSLGTFGLRGSLGPVATQADVAFDNDGGQGVSLGLAARPLGVSLVGRHSEYRGGFVDETRQLGVTDLAPLRRATDFRADGQFELKGGLTVPVSLNLRRLERMDDSRLIDGELRASAPLGPFYASSSIVWEDETRADGSGLNRWAGSTDFTTLVSTRLQLRGGLAYQISPDPRVDSAYATADWQLTETQALRLGVVRTLGPEQQTSLQGSHLWRADRFDLALNASYEVEGGDWRLGVQLGFGFGFDPSARRYRMVRPGVASGGSVAVNAWADENGDGVRQADEAGVAKIVVDAPTTALTTDADGHAFATGLGDGAFARVRLNAEGIEDPFLVGGPAVIEVEPRPGRTAVIDYPMQRAAEVELPVRLQRSDGEPRALAAVNVELVPERGGEVLTGRSDHAGVLFLEGVRPGAYTVRLQAEQARALGMTLAQPVRLVVPAAGGFVRGDAVLVTIETREAQ